MGAGMRSGILLTVLVAAALAPSPVLAAGRSCAARAAPVHAPSAVVAYKAAHDTLRLRVDLAAAARWGRSARSARSAPTCSAPPPERAVLSSLDQQGQVTDWYCGPATVSEMAATRGLRVDQDTAGRWMGTSSGTGTSVDQLTRALNHFVGEPGGGSYAFVPLSYDPTADERAAFVGRLRSDVTTYGGWPVAGDAWEVPGGPHLAGHPDVEIFHWIEIGGLSGGDATAYYADSATTVWSGVPAYTWIDTQTLVTILGGRGYAW
jgi:hypothetical protein